MANVCQLQVDNVVDGLGTDRLGIATSQQHDAIPLTFPAAKDNGRAFVVIFTVRVQQTNVDS